MMLFSVVLFQFSVLELKIISIPLIYILVIVPKLELVLYYKIRILSIGINTGTKIE